MTITVMSRSLIAVLAVAVLTGRAAADGDGGLAGAFISGQAALAGSARYRTVSQVPKELTPAELEAVHAAEFRERWTTLVAIARKEGIVTPVPNSSDAVYRLEKSGYSSDGDSDSFFLKVTGFEASDGTFVLKGVYLQWDIKRHFPSTPGGAMIETWYFSTAEYGSATVISYDRGSQRPDGSIISRAKSVDMSSNALGRMNFWLAVQVLKKL